MNFLIFIYVVVVIFASAKGESEHEDGRTELNMIKELQPIQSALQPIQSELQVNVEQVTNLKSKLSSIQSEVKNLMSNWSAMPHVAKLILESKVKSVSLDRKAITIESWGIKDWTKIGDSYYNKAFYLHGSYKDAQAYCGALGGLMIIDNSPQVHDFLAEEWVWIGLKKIEGEWKWSNGAAVETTHWPWEGYGQKDNGENCAQSYRGTWYAEKCNKRRSFVCQVPKVEKGMIKIEDGYYAYINRYKTFPEAQKICGEIDAEVAYDDSEAVHKYLSNIGKDLWIGLGDSTEEGTFTWTDGTPVNKSYWGEETGNDNGRNCALTNSGLAAGVWKMESCDKKRFPFVCQLRTSTLKLLGAY